MQGIWVFASAAARDAAVTSPQEGNYAFLKDSNTTTYYTGSAWANLAPSSGLTLLSNTTLSSTTNVSLNNVFSANYTNYKIMFSGSFVAAATDVEMRLRVSSADDSSANYYSGRGTTDIAGTFNSTGQSGATKWFMCSPTTANGNFSIDLFDPFATVKTTFSGTFLSRNLDRGGYNAGFFDTTTSFDGFSIFFANACVGTLSVYGYGI